MLFIASIEEVAFLCNWGTKEIKRLKDQVHQALVDIDNFMFIIYEKTNDFETAREAWESQMEELRRWLSLILEVKIRYI